MNVSLVSGFPRIRNRFRATAAELKPEINDGNANANEPANIGLAAILPDNPDNPAPTPFIPIIDANPPAAPAPVPIIVDAAPVIVEPILEIAPNGLPVAIAANVPNEKGKDLNILREPDNSATRPVVPKTSRFSDNDLNF